MNLLIKVGSVTNAQRSVQILSSNGYRARLKKVSSDKSNSGCGWAVVTNADEDKARTLLGKAGINIRGAEANDIS